MSESIEKKTVFAAAPLADGRPLVILGIPEGAWEELREGKTNTFDFTRIGIPLRLVLFGGKTHDECRKALEQAAFAGGCAVLDERHRDFGIHPENIGKKP